MSEMVQILGCLSCGPPPRERQDTIKWVLSLQLFMSLWVTSASNVDSNERHRQINELKQVVRFLILPSECYHVAMEGYYTIESISCMMACGGGDNCPYCRNDHVISSDDSASDSQKHS
jgi:hypothetical protein